MDRFRFLTAGDPSYNAVSATIEGIPAGVPLDSTWIARDLARHLWGYGHGWPQAFEHNQAEVLSGIRQGRTIGSPILLLVRDASNIGRGESEAGSQRLNWSVPSFDNSNQSFDLVGAVRQGQHELRNVFERSTVDETVARVAVGAVARRFLDELGVTIRSHTVAIGGVRNSVIEGEERDIDWGAVERSPVRCADESVGRRMMAAIDDARQSDDTVGGIFEVIASGVPIGLGTYAQWDRKLSSRIGQAMLSITSAKAVEIGGGFRLAHLRGSAVRDVIQLADDPNPGFGWGAVANHAGGIVRGMTNGEAIVVKVGLRPVTVRMRPNGTDPQSLADRRDICIVPAAAVLGEAMLAIVLAQTYLEKFGGDHLVETRRNFEAYIRAVQRAEETTSSEFDDLEIETVP